MCKRMERITSRFPINTITEQFHHEVIFLDHTIVPCLTNYSFSSQFTNLDLPIYLKILSIFEVQGIEFILLTSCKLSI